MIKGSGFRVRGSGLKSLGFHSARCGPKGAMFQGLLVVNVKPLLKPTQAVVCEN